MASRLAERRAAFLPACSQYPIAFSISPASVRWCAKSFGLSLHDFRELLLERVRNGGVQLRAPAFQEAGICGIPYQRVLEGIDRVWNFAPAEYQLRPHQLVKRLVQSLPRQPGDGIQQFVMRTRDPRQRRSVPPPAPVPTDRDAPSATPATLSGSPKAAEDVRGHNGRPAPAITPLSSTILVSSSMNRGTPSVRARIWSITSFGSVLPPVTRSTNAAPSRRPRRVSEIVVTCG